MRLKFRTGASDASWHQLLSKVEASRPLSAQSGSMVSRYAPSTLLFSRSEAMAREKTSRGSEKASSSAPRIPPEDSSGEGNCLITRVVVLVVAVVDV